MLNMDQQALGSDKEKTPKSEEIRTKTNVDPEEIKKITDAAEKTTQMVAIDEAQSADTRNEILDKIGVERSGVGEDVVAISAEEVEEAIEDLNSKGLEMTTDPLDKLDMILHISRIKEKSPALLDRVKLSSQQISTAVTEGLLAVNQSGGNEDAMMVLSGWLRRCSEHSIPFDQGKIGKKIDGLISGMDESHKSYWLGKDYIKLAVEAGKSSVPEGFSKEELGIGEKTGEVVAEEPNIFKDVEDIFKKGTLEELNILMDKNPKKYDLAETIFDKLVDSGNVEMAEQVLNKRIGKTGDSLETIRARALIVGYAKKGNFESAERLVKSLEGVSAEADAAKLDIERFRL